MFKVVRFWIMLLSIFALLASCGKTSGLAPSTVAASLVSFTLSPNNSFVPKGQKLQMVATGIYDDGTTKNISSEITWSVDDASVASINSSGVLSNTWTGTTGVKVLNITANSAVLGTSQTSKITITVATLTSLFVNPNSITVAPGSTQDVTVNANFSDGSTVDVTSSVTWSGGSSSVATASLGVVSGVAAGTTTLTATYSTQTANLSVTVSSSGSSGGVTLGTGLKGDYYDGINFDTFYGTRTDGTVNFNWGSGLNNLGQPAYFSIRWTGQIRAEKSETYTFYTQSDDGVRLYIDGQLVIDNWTLHGSTENTSSVTFNWAADSMHTIKLEFYENYGQAVIQLKWSSPTTTKIAVPQQFLYPN